MTLLLVFLASFLQLRGQRLSLLLQLPVKYCGGKNMGFQHGQYLKYGSGNEDNQATSSITTDSGWPGEINFQELPLSNLYVTMLHKPGVETDSFTDSTGTLAEV
jgi:hypothetical protein